MLNGYSGLALTPTVNGTATRLAGNGQKSQSADEKGRALMTLDSKSRGEG